ncbi:MAG TPA: non-canonical purine NTP pyrophosphatase [Polyangiaceae bacterium]|nr:non-canonical purine NTP pyrophosphatase [Polyangiaceae bacterium]
MADVMSIVVASSNCSRVAEIEALLAEMPIEVLTTKDALGDAAPPVTLDGETFEANALKKAQAIASASMMLTLADAAGLEVDALGGRPGVRSARFAGEGATDAENNAELLRRLEEVDDSSRTARFRAAIAVVDPWNPAAPIVVEGRVEGRIARTVSGTGGFGYEPLFIVDDEGRTLAELSEDERNELSHRAKVLRELAPKLEELVNARIEEADAVINGSYAPPPSTRGGLG